MTKIELTRRRILGGLVTIGAGSAAAGAGTFALFSDTEESNDNTLTAGTLDLQTGGTSGLTFNPDGLKPGDTGTASVELDTTSTIPANLTVRVPDVSGTEGTRAEIEDGTNDGSELLEQLNIQLWIGTGGESDTNFDSADDIVLNSTGDTTDTLNYDPVTGYEGDEWTDVITDFDGPVTFNVGWEFPSSGNNNDAQGDTVSIDFEFELVQQQQ